MKESYWTRSGRRASRAFDKHIAVFAGAMKKYPRKIGEQQFIEESRRRFDELLPRLPLHAGSTRHIFNGLMPALAAISAAFSVLRVHGYSVEWSGTTSRR
jgi:hypothetical protein